MNFGDYAGKYKSNVFKAIMTFFDVSLETLSKNTGFTEEHLDSILRQDELEKPIGKRMLSAMNLTNNDYDWISVVLHEVDFDRQLRNRKLEEIRFNQRQLKLERERVKKEHGEESSKKTSSKRKATRRRDKAEKDNSKENNREKEGRKKRVLKKGRQKEKVNV